MIKKLRNKFIGVSVISIFLVLFIILLAGNVVLRNSINNRIDGLLNLLIDNGGAFPQKEVRVTGFSFQEKSQEENYDEDNPLIKPQKRLKKDKIPGYFDIHFEINDESRYDTRYFSVIMDSNGYVISTNTGFVATVSQEDAIAFAQEVFESNKTTGYEDGFKYKMANYEGGKIIVFVDCIRDISTLNLFALISVAVLILSMMATFVIVYLFSKVALKPVEESYNKQKRFITDASHEIKTPLAVIDANTDIIEIENGESEWTKSTKNQIQRLTNLTNSLVSLARMDEEGLALEMEEFSLSDLLEEEYETYRPLAVVKNKDIKMNIEKNVKYLGNEYYIRQMLGIFLDNAIKYSTEYTDIEVELNSKKKIVIRNKTQGLEKDKNYEELFERFYRMDSSRNSSTGGYGIGLSLAKSIINMHKGKVTAKSIGTYTIEFEIRL